MTEQIIIDVNYFYDENNKKIFDIDHMTDVFNECIKNLEIKQEQIERIK
jgi:hypothetical protein